MPLKTPAQWSANWNNAMQQASEPYMKGIQATTVDPAEAAIAQQTRLVANFNAAINNGSWAGGLRASAAKGIWKANALSKGVARIGPGAQQAVPKVQAHAQAMFPVLQQLQATVASMPKGGTENALSRVRAMLTAMAQFKASKNQAA